MRHDIQRVARLIWFSLACGLIACASGQTAQERMREELERIPHPRSPSEFRSAQCLPCLNQNNTFICWSFATCSFLESEMARLKLPPVRLSVMYPAYWQYVEKARRFVQTRGASRFAPGDTFCGVPEACLQHGAVPAAAYEKTADGKLYDQMQLYRELGDYMKQVKTRGEWDEASVVEQVRKILDRHLGAPPESFTYNGKTCTPKSFLAQTVRLPWSDYVRITSFESAPFNTFTDLKVPDNWHHDTNFLNVPLPVFYDAFKGAVRAGYTVAVEMDNTEDCYQQTIRYCFIPESDIPARDIDQAARESRFRSGATEDDHAIHIIGWTNVGGQDWFLAKDSGKRAWRSGNGGVLFLNGDYVKLKVLAFIVHQDGVPQLKPLLRRAPLPH